MRLIAAATITALGACTTTPEPIVDYDAPYLGKGVLTSSPVPTARPVTHDKRCHVPGKPERNFAWCGEKSAETSDGSQSRPEKPNKPPKKSERPKKDKPTKDKGNASANNKKGGNYDRTGHKDNQKGQGRHK